MSGAKPYSAEELAARRRARALGAAFVGPACDCSTCRLIATLDELDQLARELIAEVRQRVVCGSGCHDPLALAADALEALVGKAGG